jgi:hypothetical protein
MRQVPLQNSTPHSSITSTKIMAYALYLIGVILEYEAGPATELLTAFFTNLTKNIR